MESGSRLDQVLNDWQHRDQRYEALFPSLTQKGIVLLQKEKLKDYERLHARFKNSPISGDQRALRRLLIERRQLEKSVYPNIVVRLFCRAVGSLMIRSESKKEIQRQSQNLDDIKDSLHRIGLGQYAEQAIGKAEKAGNEFSLPIALQVSEKERLDISVMFKRDGIGNFLLEGYQVCLLNGNKKQSVFIDRGSALTANHAHAMLSGKAVFNEKLGWQVIDFNDRDAEGNYRIRHTPDKFFNLSKKLDELPLKPGTNNLDRRQLLTYLQDGESVPVILEVKGKLHQVIIEADPRRNELTVYNENNERIRLNVLCNPDKEAEQQQANRKKMVVSDKGNKGVRI